jgi:putative NADH-flavin reductase
MMTSISRTILVVGATGPSGIEICKQALEAGIKVRVLVRTSSRLPSDLLLKLEVVQGDVLSSEAMMTAMRGVDAVVSALGTPLQRKPVTLLSRGTQNIMQAMAQAGVSRLLCITGMGAGDSRGHGEFLYDRVILPLLLSQIYLDKDRQEQLVRESGLDWTLIRPAFLTNGAQTGHYRRINQFENRDCMSKISRADVAHFVVQELQCGEYSQRVVNLSY